MYLHYLKGFLIIQALDMVLKFDARVQLIKRNKPNMLSHQSCVRECLSEFTNGDWARLTLNAPESQQKSSAILVCKQSGSRSDLLK